MKKWSWLLVALGFLVVGCGQPQPSSPPASTGDINQPKYGGRLTLRTPGDPYSWDVTLTSVSNVNSPIQSKGYDSLLAFKTGPDVGYNDLVLAPALAERWEISQDGKTYTFYLRKGARFHNLPPVNGREFTSADVKFSYEYSSRTGQFKDKGLRPGAFAWLLEGIESVETPDPYVAKVHFKEPFAPFLNYSAHYFLGMYAREIYEKDGDFNTTMVSLGPFIYDSAASQKGSRYVMKKHPDYWQAGRPYVDEIWHLPIPDAATESVAFQTKQIDTLSTANFRDAQDIRAKNPAVVESVRQAASGLHLYMNGHRPPFNNVLVRRAVSLGVNRDEFIKVLAGGQGAWGLAGAFPDTFSEAEIKQILRYDPEEAKRLLAQAGYTNGLDIEFNVDPAFGDIHRQQAELFQAQLKKIDLRLTLKVSEHSEYLRLTRDKNFYDITFRGKSLVSDVDSYLFAVFHPAGSNEGGGAVYDPQLTPSVEAQRRETDPVKRREIVRQAVRTIAEKAHGLVLYRAPSYFFVQPYVKNYFPNNWSNSKELVDVSLDK